METKQKQYKFSKKYKMDSAALEENRIEKQFTLYLNISSEAGFRK